MANPKELKPEEIEDLEDLFTAIGDKSLIHEYVEALAAYKNGTATEDQTTMLRSLLDLIKDVKQFKYEEKLRDPDVQRRFDEMIPPPLGERPDFPKKP